jgi:hypothetical protein
MYLAPYVEEINFNDTARARNLITGFGRTNLFLPNVFWENVGLISQKTGLIVGAKPVYSKMAVSIL